MKVIFSVSSGCIGIWWYPEKASRNDSIMCLVETSIIWSIRYRGMLSFGACFVEVCVVYTYSPLTSLLWNHHHISKPFRVLYLSDETCLQEVVYLCLNNLMAIWVETSHFLSYGLGHVDDIQLVGGQCRVDSDHI